jgi:hypothetical protein
LRGSSPQPRAARAFQFRAAWAPQLDEIAKA